MIQERAQYYVLRFPNPNATVALQQLGSIVYTDSDAPFRCYGVAIVVYNGTSGQGSVALRFSNPDQTWVQKNLQPATAVDPFDTGNPLGASGGVGPSFVYFSPVWPNILYPPLSAITVDIENLPANSDSLTLVIFIGTKLYRPGAVWAPEYPKGFKLLPFLSYPLQIPLASLPVNNLPLQIDPDAGFCWQTGQHTTVNIASSIRIGIKIKDWTGKYYMNDFVPVELMFGFDNAQIPGFPYPEIYIPKLQALFVDAVRLV